MSKPCIATSLGRSTQGAILLATVMLGPLMATAQTPQVDSPQADSPQAESPQAESPQAESPQADSPATGPVGQQSELHEVSESARPVELSGEDEKTLSTQTTADHPAGLQFHFERTPWRFVIEWLADEAGLAAHVNDLPTGSFTYSDDRIYEPDAAISRVNLFLIPERFALVRSDSLLTVINLDSEKSVRQLDALAPLVPFEQIDSRSPHDVVKCIFPLGETPSTQAIEETAGLMLMNEPTVLKNTNQLVFTETVAKLRLVREVLNRLLQPKLPEDGPVERFDLGGLNADRVLAQVRPHVGLDPLAMIGTDIRLSIDDQGRQLLASGTDEKLEAIASVLASLDQTEPASVAPVTEFRSHPMGTADPQTVVSVLQTLLANEEVRLAPELNSKQLAVLGNEHVHAIVEKTITQLANENAIEFRAIHLGNIDPRYAVMILCQMFNIAHPGLDGDKPDTPVDPRAPKIEADPLSQRLFVRGTGEQIAEIETAIRELAGRSVANDSQTTVSLLPFHGQSAAQILESAAQFWPGKETVQIIPPTNFDTNGPIEHEINPERSAPGERTTPPHEASEGAASGLNRSTTRNAKTPAFSLTSHTQRTNTAIAANGNAAAKGNVAAKGNPSVQPVLGIKAQVTKSGILVKADTPAALQKFEDHVRMIAGASDQHALGLSVFYLKHVPADIASELLQDILDAQEYGKLSDGSFEFAQQIAAFGPSTGELNDYWASDTVTVIPDKRLNRIFVYGTNEDQQDVQKHLEVIDRRESLADVQTHGSPRIIKLMHAKATAVAEVVRDAYTGRIAATAKERQEAEQRRLQADSKKTGKGDPQPNTVTSQTQGPQMTLAVDEQTNSLVVTAPDQLADEVQELIATIDEQATQSIQVRTLGTTAPQVHELLLNLLSDGAKQRTRSSTSKSSR